MARGHPPLRGAEYGRERLAGGAAPDGPPLTLGFVLARFTRKFADVLGLIACKLITLFSIFFHCNNLTRTTVFFSRFLLSRKYKIQIVAHVGRKSAVVLSGTMEASYPHFFIGIDFNGSRE